MRKMIIGLSLLLVGCSSVPSVPVTPDVKFQPKLDDAVSVYVPHFYVLTEKNALELLKTKKVLIALDYNDSIELRKSLEDINVHILKQNEIIEAMK